MLNLIDIIKQTNIKLKMITNVECMNSNYFVVNCEEMFCLNFVINQSELMGELHPISHINQLSYILLSAPSN